jgi:flagella basal body P-ring formation protein FlgA
MMRLFFFTIVSLLAVGPSVAAGPQDEALRTALASAVAERLGVTAAVVAVDVQRAPAVVAGIVGAAPAPGARLGQPIRFVVTPASGPTFTAIARVTAVVGHAVAVRALQRDAALTPEDVEWREAAIDGALLQPLPSLDEVLAARTRRAIAPGEVLSRTALVRDFAVRAGDQVTMTMRRGVIEVRGVGRAVSSGFIGDVIRILPPGSRQPARARVTAPSAVEMLR